MNIALTGSGGFLGKNIFDELKSNQLKTSVYKLKNEYDINSFLNDLKINNFDYVINCAASLNPKNNFENELNTFLPKNIQNTLKNNNKKTKLIHISTMNVLIDKLTDNYTNSKRKAEEILNIENLILIRPNLIISNSLEIMLRDFTQYIKKKLPFYPMIYPGNIYRPVDVNEISKYIVSLVINNVSNKETFNILGKSEVTTWQLFEKICKNYNKYAVKINIIFLNYILPKMIKKIFYRYRFLQQFLKIERYKLNNNNDKNIII